MTTIDCGILSSNLMSLTARDMKYVICMHLAQLLTADKFQCVPQPSNLGAKNEFLILSNHDESVREKIWFWRFSGASFGVLEPSAFGMF